MGGGRCLLKCLQELKVVNAAVFIIRYYGGVRVGAARFECMEKLAKIALRKARLIRSPLRRPVTRSQAQQHVPDQQESTSQPSSRASSFGLPSELGDNDSDSLRTADDDIQSQLDSEFSAPTDDEETPQVVKNFHKENQDFTSAAEDVNAEYADNEASENEAQEPEQNSALAS